MLANKIIGRVAATIWPSAWRTRAGRRGGCIPTAMFRLDKLSSEQIAAVVWEVLGIRRCPTRST